MALYSIYIGVNDFYKEEYNPVGDTRGFPIIGRFTLSYDFRQKVALRISEILGITPIIEFERNKTFSHGFDISIQTDLLTEAEILALLDQDNFLEWDEANIKATIKYRPIDIGHLTAKNRYKMLFKPVTKPAGLPGVDYTINNDGQWYLREGNEHTYDGNTL